MKKNLLIIIFVFLMLLCSSHVFALDDNLSLIGEGQYFSVYGPQDLNTKEILSRLNFNYFISVDGLSAKYNKSPMGVFIRTLDALYSEASDILGIHMYSFHGNIRFYSSRSALNNVISGYFNEDLQEQSYYFHEKNTIYISLPDMTLGVLGHEIAHAIISHYFVVSPASKGAGNLGRICRVWSKKTN